MPNMDDVVGNLGEPLDFVGYRLVVDDEYDLNTHANTGQQDTAVTSGIVGVIDIEIASSSGSSRVLT